MYALFLKIATVIIGLLWFLISIYVYLILGRIWEKMNSTKRKSRHLMMEQSEMDYFLRDLKENNETRRNPQ